MQQFLSNGGLSKLLWIVLMFLLGLGGVGMLFWEIATAQTPNAYVLSIVSGVAAHGFTIGGSVNASGQTQRPREGS